MKIEFILETASLSFREFVSKLKDIGARIQKPKGRMSGHYRATINGVDYIVFPHNKIKPSLITKILPQLGLDNEQILAFMQGGNIGKQARREIRKQLTEARFEEIG